MGNYADPRPGEQPHHAHSHPALQALAQSSRERRPGRLPWRPPAMRGPAARGPLRKRILRLRPWLLGASES